jgi:Ca2+-binding RTX toxin-like protein
MAVLTGGSGDAIRMDHFGSAEAEAFASATAVSGSSSQAVFSVGGSAISLSGSGFTYDGGMVTSGTVTAISATTNGQTMFTLSGFQFSYSDYASHASTGGDDALAAMFAGDDTLIGTAFNDVLNGYAGNNVIQGRGGADVLLAGDGNNHVWGNAANAAQGSDDGADVIVVGNGTNYVNGNAGADVIVAGNGANRVYGGSGDDVITLGNGNNQVNGNTGNDVILVGTGDNVVRGGQGNDVITVALGSHAGNNILSGDVGDDVIHGGGGYDLMTGGAGTDVFHIGGGTSHATTVGGQVYDDEITDFTIGTDKLVVDGYTVDRVLAASQPVANTTVAYAYASSVLGQSGDPHAVAAVAVGTDTYLFFHGSDASSAVDQVVRLDGIAHPDTLTVTSLFG